MLTHGCMAWCQSRAAWHCLTCATFQLPTFEPPTNSVHASVRHSCKLSHIHALLCVTKRLTTTNLQATQPFRLLQSCSADAHNTKQCSLIRIPCPTVSAPAILLERSLLMDSRLAGVAASAPALVPSLACCCCSSGAASGAPLPLG